LAVGVGELEGVGLVGVAADDQSSVVDLPVVAVGSPAERGEVPGLGGPAVFPVAEVVDLEVGLYRAAGDDAAAVACLDHGAQSGIDDVLASAEPDVAELVGAPEPDLGVAELLLAERGGQRGAEVDLGVVGVVGVEVQVDQVAAIVRGGARRAPARLPRRGRRHRRRCRR
jgi:hypothetical protein